MDPDELFNEVTSQTVEIVLTAHPTQVNRRTLQYKHAKIAALLQQHDRCAGVRVCRCVGAWVSVCMCGVGAWLFGAGGAGGSAGRG